eukprot:scaffold649117_cov42-Prasinocladus_malaysianus.AAC.1
MAAPQPAGHDGSDAVGVGHQLGLVQHDPPEAKLEQRGAVARDLLAHAFVAHEYDVQVGQGGPLPAWPDLH